jgi:hypothetical protein
MIVLAEEDWHTLCSVREKKEVAGTHVWLHRESATGHAILRVSQSQFQRILLSGIWPEGACQQSRDIFQAAWLRFRSANGLSLHVFVGPTSPKPGARM